MENVEMNHSGVLGMKWGVRLYQNKDGSLTALGRKRYGTKTNLTKAKRQATLEAKKKEAAKAEAKAAKDAKKSQAEEAKKIKTAEEEKAELAAKKEKVLKSRSAKELYDNADLFTTQELRDAYSRLSLERDIKNLQPETVSKGKKFVDTLGTVATGVKNTNDILNNTTKALGEIGKLKKMFGSDESDGKSNKTKTDKSGEEETATDKSGKTKNKNKTESDKSAKEDKTDKTGKNKKEQKDEPLTGTIIGEGTSSKTFNEKHSKSSKNSSSETIWDADFEDITSSGKSYTNDFMKSSGNKTTKPSTELVSTGKSFINDLLSDSDRGKSYRKDISTELGSMALEARKTISDGLETYRKNQQ
jgi:hypothetical protein